MNTFSFIALITWLTTLFLAILILRFGNMRNLAHRTLLLLNLGLVVWGFGRMMVGISVSPSVALEWWKIAHIGGVFTSVFILHNVLAVTGTFNTGHRAFLIFAYGQAVLFQILSFSNLLNLHVTMLLGSYYHLSSRTFEYPVFTFFYMLICSYAYLILVNGFLHAQQQKRIQFKYHLIAFSFGIVGGFTHFFTVYSPSILPYGALLVPVFPLLTTYAILRHQLLEIEVIVKKTLVFTGLLASVFAMLVLPTLVIQEYLFREAGAGGRMIGLAISGVIIIVTMRKIEDFLTNVTDRYLFQKKYDYKSLLKTFTGEVLTVLNLDKLLNLTVDKLIDIIKLDSSAVLLFDEQDQRFTIAASKGLKDPAVNLGPSDDIVAYLEHAHGYLSKKELAEKKVYIPAHVQEVIDKLNAELMIPMILQGKFIGIIALGKKKSDEDYTQDDLDILLPLARTLAIAISNAQLFEELGKTQAEAAQKEKMAVIGTLSAGINHEICNPLGIARGQCEAFLLNYRDGLYKDKSPEELIAKAQKIMELVIKEVDRATVITKKLSSFAKPAKGTAEMVKVSEEIDYVMSLVGHELRLEKIEIEKAIPDDLPAIFVDRKQIEEVLFNLIRNAGQAIGERGKITISARQARNRIVIDIADTGSGIADDKIKELFNPFFTTKDPDKGTGLGLFIVRQVVEKNHGHIYLKQTKVDQGTTFTLEFPVMVREPVAV